MMDDGPIRKRHVSLPTQQHRLRHLRGICARNISPELIPNHIKDDFLLHCTINLVPSQTVIYKSEIIENSLNPSWGLFEMAHFPEETSSSTSVVQVKIWCSNKSRTGLENSHLIIEWTIHFTGLYYIGEQIPKDGKRFTANSVICYMLEGHYSCENCLLIHSNKSKLSNDYVIVEANNFRQSYNLSSVQRIHTVQRAMKQTKAAVQREWQLIKKRLCDIEESKQLQAQVEQAKIKLRLLNDEVQHQQKKIQQMQHNCQCNSSSLHNRNVEIESRNEKLKVYKEDLLRNYKSYVNDRESLIKIASYAMLRWKQLISELSDVYPIQQIPDKPFQICAVPLPNSEDFEGSQDVMISVALGYVAHLLLMISRFLNVPLRYPIIHHGSRSMICDYFLDKSVKEREFPLFLKAKHRVQEPTFEYGVYLLNKNIAQFRHFMNMNTQDLRATLPNLFNLIETKLSIRGEKMLIRQMPRLPIKNALGANSSPISNTIIDDRSTSYSSEGDRKYSNESETKNIEPSSPNFIADSLARASDKKDDNATNNTLSYSLDEGLDKMSLSSSPNPLTKFKSKNMRRQMSASQIDGTVAKQHDANFYKAAVNIWITTQSSDDEAAQSSDDLRQKPRDSNCITEDVNDSETKESDGAEPGDINGDCSAAKGTDDDIDCDTINCRAQVLAERSGSFKQLQPSKKL